MMSAFSSINVLIILASPSNRRLEIPHFISEVQHGVEEASGQKWDQSINFRYEPACRVDELAKVLTASFHVSIVHFYCHGCECGLVLLDSQGKHQMIESQALANNFTLQSMKNARVVLLTGCQTQEPAKAIINTSSTVEFVIASTRKVDEYESTFFSKFFYHQIALGMNIEEAFNGSIVHLKNSPSSRSDLQNGNDPFLLFKSKRLAPCYKLALQAFPLLVPDILVPQGTHKVDNIRAISHDDPALQQVMTRLSQLRDRVSRLHDTPANEAIKLVFERDGIVKQLLGVARKERIKCAQWSRPEFSQFLQPRYCTHIDQLLDHATRWTSSDDEYERVVCMMEEESGEWPKVYIFLLRLGYQNLDPKFFGLMVLDNPNEYISDNISNELLNKCIYPYHGKKDDVISIYDWLVNHQVDMESTWSDIGEQGSIQVFKAREWLRCCCISARIILTGTSYQMKHIAEKWQGQFSEIKYISNVAMKIALVAEGFRIYIQADAKNVQANAIVLP